MPEMSRFEKWSVNRRGERFFRTLLARVDRERGLVLPEGATILELGTGNGTLSGLLYRRYHPKHIYATDYDPEQVQVARKNLDGKFGTLPEGFTIERADAEHLQYPDATFDLVVAHLMLHHVGSVNDEQRALGEITRVLRPGGLFFYREMIRKRLVREEIARLGYYVIFRARSFRFFGFADTVIAASPRTRRPVEPPSC